MKLDRCHHTHTRVALCWVRCVVRSPHAPLQEAEAWVTDLRAKVANKGPNGENMTVPVIMFVNKGATDTLPPLSSHSF